MVGGVFMSMKEHRSTSMCARDTYWTTFLSSIRQITLLSVYQ